MIGEKKETVTHPQILMLRSNIWTQDKDYGEAGCLEAGSEGKRWKT